MRAGVLGVVLALGMLLSGSAAPAATPAQLALMPLPKPLLPAAAYALPLDPDSGVITNAKAVDNATQPTSAATLVRLGRISGYALDYSDRSGSALNARHGLLEVETTVELYRDADAAHDGLGFWHRDDQRVSKLSSPGLSVSLRVLPAGGVGDESFGYLATGNVPGKAPIYATEVRFRHGSLLGEVSVSAADPASPKALIVTLAHRLDARIAQVLAGKITGAPVPIPGKTKAGPPPHGPDLSRLAVTAADLHGGTVTKQGYQLDDDLSPVSEYHRHMTSGGTFAVVDEKVALFHSETEASYSLSIFSSAFTSPALQSLAGAELRKSHIVRFHYTPVKVSGGDEAKAVLGTLTLTNGLTVDEGLVFVRVGKTTEFLNAIAPAGVRLPPSALVDLARIAASRAEQGLHKSNVA